MFSGTRYRKSEHHTCIFGLQVEEPSKAETLHFSWRQDVIPAENSSASLLCTSVVALDFILLALLLPVPVHYFIQPACALQETGLDCLIQDQ